MGAGRGMTHTERSLGRSLFKEGAGRSRTAPTSLPARGSTAEPVGLDRRREAARPSLRRRLLPLRRLRLGHAVSDAGLGEDVGGVDRAVAQLAAQPLDDGAHRPRVAGVLRSPDPAQQVLVGQRPTSTWAALAVAPRPRRSRRRRSGAPSAPGSRSAVSSGPPRSGRTRPRCPARSGRAGGTGLRNSRPLECR